MSVPPNDVMGVLPEDTALLVIAAMAAIPLALSSIGTYTMVLDGLSSWAFARLTFFFLVLMA